MAAYATGIGALVILMVAWVGIQNAWRRAFPDACEDADVLAQRSGCPRSPSCGGACGHPRGRA